MNINSLNLKLILGITYLVIISICLYFLFSIVDIKDLTNYEFIRKNKNIILGTWQDLYLFEHRLQKQNRKISHHLMGE